MASVTDGHEFEQVPEDNEGQRSLAVHGVIELDMTEQLNIKNSFTISKFWKYH